MDGEKGMGERGRREEMRTGPERKKEEDAYRKLEE